MKHIILTLLTFHFSLFTFHSSAAVPLKWNVETSRAVPAQFEAYQGETLALEATLQSYGKPLEAPANYSLYWQTNGMGSTYWSVQCPSSATTTNVLFATWSPTNDVSAKVYNCFIGKPGTIYHAAFQLRLRPSPGATPNELPLPQKVIDFAKVTVLNPPWSGGGGGGGVDTNAVREIAREEIEQATNAVNVAMTNRYTKAETDSKIAEAVEANEKTGTSEQVVRGRLNGDIWDVDVSYANESGQANSAHDAEMDSRGNVIHTTYATKDEIDGKRDLTDNTCHKTELTEWVCNPAGDGYGNTYSISYYQDEGAYYLNLLPAHPVIASILSERDDKVVLDFYGGVIATRSAVCTDGEKFVTSDIVDGKVNSAVSTNNPAFVSAVRNTPTSGMPDDMPTDWGTYGTVGAALAALAAFVKWAKAKIVAVIGDDGKPTDTFATDLFGKPVAKEAIDNRTKSSASAITGDALTLPDGGVVSASSSAPTITFGTARQTNGLRFCELYITNPDTAADGAIVSISGKVYSDISLIDLPKLEKGATYYFTFAEFKVENGVSHWKVSKQKLDAMGGDIPTPTAA